jgi:hypothetical protein
VLRSSEEIIHLEQTKYTKEKMAQFFMVQEQPQNRKEKSADTKECYVLRRGKVPLQKSLSNFLPPSAYWSCGSQIQKAPIARPSLL